MRERYIEKIDIILEENVVDKLEFDLKSFVSTKIRLWLFAERDLNGFSPELLFDLQDYADSKIFGYKECSHVE